MKHKNLISSFSNLSNVRAQLSQKKVLGNWEKSVKTVKTKRAKYVQHGTATYKFNTAQFNEPEVSTKVTDEPKFVCASNNKLQQEDLGKITFKEVDPSVDAPYNSFGIQMIPPSLRERLFSTPCVEISKDIAGECHNELNKFGLNQQAPVINRSIDISLPETMSNLPNFFQNIAEDQLHPYTQFIAALIEKRTLPSMPEEWSRTPGWTKYTVDQGPVPVPYPECPGIVFDVEVCILNGNQLPALAVSMSPDYVYSWVSPALDEPWLYSRTPTTDYLIPLGEEEKLVVGHHVMYDRARVAEEYSEHRSKLRFLDTQSLHVCVSGLENTQKGAWLGANETGKFDKAWMKVGSPNSLAATHKLYCGTDLDKTARDVFVTGTHTDIQEQFQSLVQYCASDVVATRDVFMEVWKLYKERFPSPVTLAGMFEMASCFIPVNQNWQRYTTQADSMFYNAQGEIEQVLSKLADETLLGYHLNKEETLTDPWMSQLDWSSKKSLGIKNKKLSKKAQAEEDTRRKDEREGIITIESVINTVCNEKPDKPKHYSGAPEWYRGLCPKADTYSDVSWKREPCEVSLATATAPILLKLACFGKTVYRTHHHGWGYLEPKSREDAEIDQQIIKQFYPDVTILDQLEVSSKDAEITVEDTKSMYSENIQNIENQIELISKREEPRSVFVQHDFVKMLLNSLKTGNVGSPLSKSFTDSIEGGVVTSCGGREAKQILTLGTGLTSWRNTRSRILSQFVVKLQEADLTDKEILERQEKTCVILPQVVPAGTITRRATEQLWMTASNVRSDRVGSEFKGVVTPFPGYCFVGADVDSQELWIASLIGDATFGEHGATPLGWMNLQGKKADGTDMHSKTAAELSGDTPGLVSRDLAKAFNYARIYGSGKGLARNMLKDCCKEMSEEEINASIDQMFASTKGSQVYPLTNFGKKQAWMHGFEYDEITDNDLSSLVAVTGYNRYQLAYTRTSRFSGGTESAMFNKLEEIAISDHPETPFLKSRITRTLEPSVIQKTYQLNSRVNWVVQSSAVDFLHLLLVSMKWLMGQYGIPGRFAISIHDEVRFHVPESHKYEAALALQIANLATRAYFSTQLGIHDLPNSVAFFSGVDLDRALRKNVRDECVTPSNPHGLSVSYGIEPGEELDIFEILKHCDTLHSKA